MLKNCDENVVAHVITVHVLIDLDIPNDVEGS
jgi:hypothetical protein